MKNPYLFILLFVISDLSLAQWSQIGQDIDGEAPGDQSGYAVSLNSSGSIVAIGAFNNNGIFNSAGHVRVFESSNGNWVQMGSDIDGESTAEHSGSSVCLSSSGNVVAVGAIWSDANGTRSGDVKIYEYIGGNWIKIGNNIAGEAIQDESGWSVSLSSDGLIVAIGARFNDANGSQSGHVRVYKNYSGNWVQLGNDIDGEAAYDWMGNSVSLNSDGSILAVGANGYDQTVYDIGQVKVFEYNGVDWVQIGSDITGFNEFDATGTAVSLSTDGKILAVGSSGVDANGINSGQVKIYEYDGVNWTQVGNDINGEAAYDLSGHVSLSSNGNVVAVGALYNDGSATDAGHVRVFENSNGNWVQMGSDIDGEAFEDYSGKALSINSDGLVIAIGAYLNDGNGFNSGHARVYGVTTSFIENSLNEDLLIYPNPTTGEIIVDAEGIERIEVINIHGDLVLQQKSIFKHQKCELEISSRSKGLYIIKVKTDRQIIIGKLLKQ